MTLRVKASQFVFLITWAMLAMAGPAWSSAIDDRYAAMIANPADPDLTLAYSREAVSAGDYESAIPPLERLLMNDPAQPDIRLEIGVLYYLLDSKTVAKGYLSDVANDPHASRDASARARSYLAKL